MGRKKIEIKLVKDPNVRQVTFSKRRTGLFKKASELSILCGTEVAAVVFSPGNKPYSFAHPNVDAVAAEFLQQEPNSNEAHGSSSSNEANLDELNQQLLDLTNQSCEEAKKGKLYDEALKNQSNKTKLQDLQELHESAAELRCLIKERLNEMEAAEAMLVMKEQPVEFSENHVAKKKKRKTKA
ncbi:hypothetical protein RIF29_11526 [Crotalaria pallida]|uniref:MADS-box domain-containing protein n=1 Tax=Crotalaria pallida TaxID=3830 RepID=A0AAN9IM84_CROPI